MNLTKEVIEIANELSHKTSCSNALDIAVKIQRNRILSDIFVLREGVPSAIEAIAIQLGYNNKYTTQTIPDQIGAISESIDEMTNIIANLIEQQS